MRALRITQYSSLMIAMSLTPEQQQALDELFAQVPGASRPTHEAPDILKTWLGVSGSELKAKLFTLLDRKNDFERQLLDLAESNPFDSAFGFLAAASLGFYSA